MTQILPYNAGFFRMEWIFYCRTANIIVASIISFSEFPIRTIKQPHSDFIQYDILKASSTISVLSSVSLSSFFNLLDTSFNKYLTHFRYFSIQHSLKTLAIRYAFFSSCSSLDPGNRIKARPKTIYTNFPTTTFARSIELAFCWSRKECFFQFVQFFLGQIFNLEFVRSSQKSTLKEGFIKDLPVLWSFWAAIFA